MFKGSRPDQKVNELETRNIQAILDIHSAVQNT